MCAAGTASSIAVIDPLTLTNPRHDGRRTDESQSGRPQASPSRERRADYRQLSSIAEPDTINVSATMNTRNPAASCESPWRR